MLEGPILLFIIAVAVVFIIISSSILKLHPFIALLLATFGVGIAVGMPLLEIVENVNAGFGSLMGSIGLLVVIGSIIGVILEKSGAAIKIADTILNVLGKKRPALAMSVIGAAVSIPVFCDSGFIILSRLPKVLAERTKVTKATLSLALASGLYTTHTLIPPTPGPIAAAGNLGASGYLGTIIIMGFVVSLPTLFIAYWYAYKAGKKINIQTSFEQESQTPVQQNISFYKAVAPILVPIAFIAVASFARVFSLPDSWMTWIAFFGHPLVALFIGMLMAFALFEKWDKEHLSDWIGNGIVQAGPILAITGAGGAFGFLLKATPIAAYINSWVDDSQTSGAVFLIVTFLIAALLKTAQGSSTSALVITSSMLAPLMATVGFDSPIGLSLVVLAIGGGAMTISHANDSYFWVVAQFSGFSLKDAYKGFTVLTLLQGTSVLLTTLILYWLIL